MNGLHERLNMLMDEAEVEVTDVAIELGVSDGSVYRFLKGARVKTEYVVQLADYFGVTTDYLLKGESDDLPPDHSLRVINSISSQLNPEDRAALAKALKAIASIRPP